MARFRSELHIPVHRDEMNFQDRQVKSWQDTETKMEQQKKEWDDEFDRLRSDFFTLKPVDKIRNSPERLDQLKTNYETDPFGNQKFMVRFDVSEFRPEEIQVRTQDGKISVSAKQLQKSSTSSVSKEYNRNIDIPSNVDEDKLQCVLSKDGILTVEGPLKKGHLVTTNYLPIQQGPGSVSPGSVSPVPTIHNQVAISKPLEVATPVKNPIITEPDGTRKLRLSVDVGEFKPDEIVVKTAEKKLIVHAEHEEKLSGRTLHKEFNKEYELPDSVDQSAITAYIGDEGKLYIEAPLKPAQQKRYSITQTHDVRKVVVTKESQVTITDSQNRPMITINVHRN